MSSAPTLFLLTRVALVLLLLVGLTTASVTEPLTGISFPDNYKKTHLTKLGVRTKGPIKVYAVGQYGVSGKSSFMLKLNMGVSGEKMSDALGDAMKPRCKDLGCTQEDIDEFESLVLGGLPDGAKKGGTLVFGTGGGKLTVIVNDEVIGSVKSKSLATAFEGIYTDKNAVCKLKSVEEAEETDTFFDDLSSIIIVGVITTVHVLVWAFAIKKKTLVKVCELNVYPIKSCAEQSVESAIVTTRGFQGDRILQVVDKNGKYCTPRDADKVKLFKVQPALNGSQLTINAPDMVTLEMDLDKAQTKPTMVELNEVPNKMELQDYGSPVATWMEKATGIKKCRVTGVGDDFKRQILVNEAQGDAVPATPGPPLVSLADEAPFLLTSTSSLNDLNKRLLKRGKTKVDMRRFRPNLVITGLAPWEEDTLNKIKVGNVEFRVWQRCGRCIMTTIDRDTLLRTSEPMATFSTFRERDHGMRNFGMHLIPVVEPGKPQEQYKVSVGDKVEILEYDKDRLKEWKLLFGK